MSLRALAAKSYPSLSAACVGDEPGPVLGLDGSSITSESTLRELRADERCSVRGKLVISATWRGEVERRRRHVMSCVI